METKQEDVKNTNDAVEYLLNTTDRTLPMESSKSNPPKDQTRKVRNTVGLLLTIVMLSLTGYVLYIQSGNYQTLQQTTDLDSDAYAKQSKNYRHYVREYTTAKQQLNETQARLQKMTLELELVSKELDSTKSMLRETEALLTQAQQENLVLKGDPEAMSNMQKLFGNQAAASKNVEDLQKQNEAYVGQLSQLRGELTNYQTNVSDIKEAKSMISELKSKIREVRDKMRSLKKDAEQAREAAQIERDRQLLLLGNNGFVIKDGESQLTDKPKRTVDIDVKFVP